MALFLDNVRNYLLGNGVSWPVTIGFMPDDADDWIGIFETGGMPADTIGRENQRVTFQVRVRAARLDYLVCRTMWQTVFNLLQDAQAGNGYLPGVAYIQALHFGPLFFNDDQGRSNMTANWRVMMEADSGTV